MTFILLAAAALCCVASSSASIDADDGLCPSSGQCLRPPAGSNVSSHYYWPHGKGHPHHYGKSPYTGSFSGFPCNLSASLKWSWHYPGNKYKTMIMGSPAIDGERNLYLTIMGGIKKFSPDGKILWSWDKAEPWFYLMNTPALMDGLIYTCSTDAKVHALDMDTGRMVWTTQLKTQTGIEGDNGFVVARDGWVILDGDRSEATANKPNKIFCLNGTTGDLLWEFMPDIGVWNFLPMFPQSGGMSDGTIVFQSISGSAYRVNVTTGEQLWRAGQRPFEATFTDGGAALGPNNVLYTVSSLGWQVAHRSDRGGLHAFRVADGQLLWENTSLHAGVFTWPVVAQLEDGAKLSVVTGVGSLASYPLQEIVLKMSDRIQSFAAAGLVLRALITVARTGLKGLLRVRSVCVLAWWSAVAAFVAFLLTMYQFVFAYAVLSFSYPYSIHAYDAQTGEPQWQVQLPTWHWVSAAGDEAGYQTRRRETPWRTFALPCASSYPTVDARGVIYFTHMDGSIYSIKDWNGDGTIDSDTELCRFHAGASGFTAGPSIAPGMLAVSTTDTMFVFGE
mmetsp:Transcript_9682/g.30809  ORF Transcript_9682/g.30809 Transcript_9682/m.30809 type:complete len:561 (-) Transcript_9682:84-1766(-)